MHLNKLKRTQRIVFQLITIMRLRNLFRIKKEAWALVKALDSLNSSNVEYSDPEQMSDVATANRVSCSTKKGHRTDISRRLGLYKCEIWTALLN